MTSVAPLRPEQRIISDWRRAGHCASAVARENVTSTIWCTTCLQNHAAQPLSKGDLALIMEYAADANVRRQAARLVLAGQVES